MTNKRFDRRAFLKASLATAGLAACSRSEAPGATPQAKQPAPAARAKAPGEAGGAGPVVVLGFDGVDPRLVERFMAAGKLPALAGLQKAGGFSPLGSTSPPNSPVAWTSFASGKHPTEHGVFGFLKRDPATYLPGTAPYTVSAPRFEGGRTIAPRAVSHRVGPAFWDHLDRAGVKTELLWVPYAFPPPALKHGRVLCGLGSPDARFTNSSFTLYTSAPAAPGESDRVAGGRIVRLATQGATVETQIEGPRGPEGKPLSAPLALALDRKAKALTIALGGRKETVSEGGRSDWFRFRFETAGFALAARVRFHLLAVASELRLYATPLQLDPDEPLMPLGAPLDWARQAVDAFSLPTVGWAHDTSAVNAGALPRQVFLGSVLDTMEARAALLEQELAGGAFQMLTAVFTGTDRAGHIFYKDLEQEDGGPLGQVYQAMDRIVARVRGRLPPGARLIVMSDHGFHAFTRQLHVNTWLEQQDLFKRAKPGGAVNFLRGVDWAASQAYSMGNGQVYANLKGREKSGSVSPGPAHAGLLAKIREQLLALRDPSTGEKPVRAVYPVAEKAALALRERAPDLQIAFAPGWRNSWETTLGGAPTGGIFADNPKAWCGDHAASDVVETPGILFSDRKLAAADPHLVDLSASLLGHFGLDPDGPGRRLWT